jgi:hypothetical protein
MPSRAAERQNYVNIAGNCEILLHGLLMVAPHDTLSAFTLFTAPLQDAISRLCAVGEN